MFLHCVHVRANALELMYFHAYSETLLTDHVIGYLTADDECKAAVKTADTIWNAIPKHKRFQNKSICDRLFDLYTYWLHDSARLISTHLQHKFYVPPLPSQKLCQDCYAMLRKHKRKGKQEDTNTTTRKCA